MKIKKDKVDFSTVEMLEIVEAYILEHKGVNVRINEPMNRLRVEMLIFAFNIACDYYVKD